jgi:Flp pilus assembly protein TadG
VQDKRHARAALQRGIAMVEMAIALPVLLLLLLATAEIGRILSQYNKLTNSTRDACRYAASNAAVGTTRLVNLTPQLQAATSNLLVTGNVNGTGNPILPGLATSSVVLSNAGNGYVSVSVSYTYQPMIGSALPTFGYGSSISWALPLGAVVIMRAL